LAQHGVMAVFEAANSAFSVQARVLREPGGERLLTDLRHVAELLNEVSVRERLAPQALVEWLSDRITEGSRDGGVDERSRRLETDRDAVQIMTVHRAKGLEFPVVLLPDAADAFHSSEHASPKVLHIDGRRVLDTGNDDQRPLRHEQALLEESAEDLRDLYVAMTRATARLVMWWARTNANTHESPLHRLLARSRVAGVTPELGYPSPFDPGEAGLDPALVDVRHYSSRSIPPDEVQPPSPRPLAARTFARAIDPTWRRTSYSGLTSELHGAPSPWAEVDEPDLDSEPLPTVSETAVASALADLPGGTEFGSLVHAILEQVDPQSPDLSADVSGLVEHWTTRSSLTTLDRDALSAGLLEVLDTPLGQLAPGLRLRDIGVGDRLAELDFELPMGRGSARTVRDLASALSEHIPTSHLLGPYGRQLGASAAADRTLHGFLTGSIDAVLRVGAEPRHLVIDYKTNRMPVLAGESLTVDHYRPAAMARAMMDAHYPLQALLYSVALHRHLGQRLRDYSPDVHLGGVGYLFVRGMAGPQTPVNDGMPAGVFTWHPSTDLILAASAVLEGGTR
ncbi:MAG TPA: 3'-5' exonuclease, partial [Propionibacteriaceae bacterium]|nr:3'-5' exonuclease [Propionibacteriaceae bacterium]